MSALFKKSKKPMSERPNGSADPHATADQSMTEPQNEDRTNPLAMASEAAAEHVMHDADAQGREDITELQGQLDASRNEVNDLKDRWLRLNAEFDNFRKRTAKERLELIQFAGENVLRNVIPVVDDMERAIANNDNTSDIAVVKEGFHLIHAKLLHILGAQGVRPLPDAKGQPFDTDQHEAITKAPATSDDLKGKVIDVVEQGYTLHDRVIRYAKVVVGE